MPPTAVKMVDWPGLLAWSTKYHDGTHTSEFKQMSDEDRAFLEKAMEEAFGKIEDPNEVMAEAIKQLKAPDRTDESITTALEVVDRCCDDPDCARNCEKLDGIQPLLDLLGSYTGAIRDRALEILALLFANNPAIQEVGMRRDALPRFLQLVRESAVGSETRSKAFRAMVALVRNMQAFEECFVKEHDGAKVLVSCADESDARLSEKMASFVRSLAQSGRLQTEDVAAIAAALSPLLRNIGNGQIQYREVLSSSVCELARASPAACLPELKAAAQERLSQLGAAGEDEATERSSLQECIALLGS